MTCFLAFMGLVSANAQPEPDAQGDQQQQNSQYAAVVGMTDDLKFEPEQVTISAGDTILWRNTSNIPHTVTADPELPNDKSHVVLPDGAETFNSGNLQAGDTFTHTFTVSGEYKYFCIPHEAAGMIGTVTVRSQEQPQKAQTDEEQPEEQPREDAEEEQDKSRAASDAQQDDPTPAGSPPSIDQPQPPAPDKQPDGEAQTADKKPTDKDPADAEDADAKETAQDVQAEQDAPAAETTDQARGSRHQAPGRQPGDNPFVQFLRWIGKFHPPLISFPIGLLVTAAVAELLYLASGREFFSVSGRFCTYVGCGTAILAGFLGWCLAGFRLSDPLWMLETHRWLGTSLVVWTVLVLGLAIQSQRKKSRGLTTAYRVTLIIAAVLVLVTGFFGGAMIYGIDHYAWPAPSKAVTQPSISPEEAAATVEMTDQLTYEPRKVTIEAGESILWTNPSSVVHTVTADPELANNPEEHVQLPEGAESFNSGDIPAGGNYSRQFPVAGRYTYFCIPHEAAGMIGEIQVTPSSGGQ